MPTPRASSTTPSRRPASKGSAPHAVQLLKADHAEVKKLLKEYDKLAKEQAPDEERQALATQICQQLTVHATIEEEIFYPAAREVLGEEDDLVDEATVEHGSAKELISKIESMSPDEDLYDATVKVLGEYIQHHVKEEQDELFPKLTRKMDMREIGQRLQERKEELMQERTH